MGFMRIRSLKAGFRYKRVNYNQLFHKEIYAIGAGAHDMLRYKKEFDINGFNCIKYLLFY